MRLAEPEHDFCATIIIWDDTIFPYFTLYT